MGKLTKQLEETIKMMKNHPEKAFKTFTVDTRLMKGFKCDVRAEGFHYYVDESESLGGTNKGLNPLQWLLASLATCQEITFRVFTELLDIDIEELHICAEGDIDLRGFFAIDDAIRPGFSEIRYTIEIATDAEDSKLKELVKTVEKYCPVYDMLSKGTKISYTTKKIKKQ